MNLFATILTNSAPSANYRGENQNNRATLQRNTSGRFEYAVISPEAIRNGLRECLRQYAEAGAADISLNRQRLVRTHPRPAVSIRSRPERREIRHAP